MLSIKSGLWGLPRSKFTVNWAKIFLICITLSLHEMYILSVLIKSGIFILLWVLLEGLVLSLRALTLTDSRKPFGKQYKGYKGNRRVVVARVRVQDINGLDLQNQLEGGEPQGGIIRLVLRSDHSPILQLSLVYCLDHSQRLLETLWPKASIDTWPTYSGKGVALSGSVVSPNPPLVSNPVNTVHTSSDHGDVTSTCSFPAELPPSVALESKSSAKVARA